MNNYEEFNKIFDQELIDLSERFSLKAQELDISFSFQVQHSVGNNTFQFLNKSWGTRSELVSLLVIMIKEGCKTLFFSREDLFLLLEATDEH